MSTQDGQSTAPNGSAGASETAQEQKPPENEYGLPPFMMKTGLELYGVRLGMSLIHPDVAAHVKNLRALPMREDDVIIAAYPKCGTHWTWEVVQMLVNKSSQYEKRSKEHVMMEFCEIDTLEAERSPRVFNSHNWMCHLPTEIVTKKPRIIHVVRNPKDTLVSFYYHMKQIPGSAFTFDNLFKAYIDDALNQTNQIEYLHQMSEFHKAHPDVPYKLIYFEEMKKEPVKITKELAQFLNVQASDELCEEIAIACSFDKMKAVDEKSKELPELLVQKAKEMMPDWDKSKLQMFRKGTIGDWKNHFTVAQNEIFDDFLARETAKGLDYKFIYE